HGGLCLGPEVSVDVPRTKFLRCQRLLNPGNDCAVHIRDIARVKLGRGLDRRHPGDGVVLYVWNENANVPSPAMNGVGDDAEFPSLSFTDPTFAVAQRDASHAATRWEPKDHTAQRRCRLVDRNADAAFLYVRLPRARARIRF